MNFRYSSSSPWARRISLALTGLVVPPGWMARLLGHLPANRPSTPSISSRSRSARANELPAEGRKRCASCSR